MSEQDTYNMTPAAKKLYLVLIDPENVGKSVTEICRIAGVGRDTYYRHFKDERFVELVKDTSLNLVKAKIGDVVNATYLYAMGEKGHQDRKLLLTMAGIYSDKVEATVHGDLDIGSVSASLERYLTTEYSRGEDSNEEDVNGG